MDENDLVDGAVANTLVSTTGLTCEVIFVGDVKLPADPPLPTAQ